MASCAHPLLTARYAPLPFPFQVGGTPGTLHGRVCGPTLATSLITCKVEVLDPIEFLIWGNVGFEESRLASVVKSRGHAEVWKREPTVCLLSLGNLGLPLMKQDGTISNILLGSCRKECTVVVTVSNGVSVCCRTQRHLLH